MAPSRDTWPPDARARYARGVASRVAGLLAMVAAFVGVAFNQPLFGRLERRVAERWGFRVTGA